MAEGGARKTSNHLQTSIFLLYLHKVIIFNMLIEIVQKLLKSEGHALPGCYCLTNPKPSAHQTLFHLFFSDPQLKLHSYALLCAPETLTTLNRSSVSYFSLSYYAVN